MTAVPQPLAATPPKKEGRDRYLYGLTLGMALFLSVLMHGSIFLSLLRGGGPPAGSGEGGVQGGGDVTVDISVAGPVAPVIAPPTHSSLAPPTPPEPSPSPEPAPAIVPPHPHTPPVHHDEPQPDSPEPPPPEPTAPQSAPTADATDTGRPMDTDTPASGTGADTTSGGRMAGLPDDALRSLVMGMAGDAPDTVEGQRALLPAAMTCHDPVAGTWRAFKYNPLTSDWVRFTLVVHHDADGTLTGTITSRIWFGGPFTRTPPECEPGLPDYTVRMPAHGRVDAHNHLTFGSSSYTVVAVHCPIDQYDYAPDNFSGTIDSMRQEFQSVNNDGAWDINSPYLFRRTGCVDE